MNPSPLRPRSLALALVLLLAGAACRNASSTPTASSPFRPSLAGTGGCNGPDQAFAGLGTPIDLASKLDLSTVPNVPAGAVLDAIHQIAAPTDAEVLYATATMSLPMTTMVWSTVVEIDFTGGGGPDDPVVRPLLDFDMGSMNPVESFLLLAGIMAPAQLSGIAVLDAGTLLAIERTSNTILAISRSTSDTVGLFAGFPFQTPGYADGLLPAARFSFTADAQLVSTDNGSVIIADPGNQAVRAILFDSTFLPLGATFTLAGLLIPGTNPPGQFSLGATLFDTPVGVSVDCSGRVLVLERGDTGFGGHRLRALSVVNLNTLTFAFDGFSDTLAGDGTRTTSTAGVRGAAQLAAPESLASSAGGEVYWVDSATGAMRRMLLSSGDVDCPLSGDCSLADFTPGASFSIAITAGGTLYVWDSLALTLTRVL